MPTACRTSGRCGWSRGTASCSPAGCTGSPWPTGCRQWSSPTPSDRAVACGRPGSTMTSHRISPSDSNGIPEASRVRSRRSRWRQPALPLVISRYTLVAIIAGPFGYSSARPASRTTSRSGTGRSSSSNGVRRRGYPVSSIDARYTTVAPSAAPGSSPSRKAGWSRSTTAHAAASICAASRSSA